MKIQRKISLIFRTDFILALIFRHFIGLSRYFRIWKVITQIKNLNQINSIKLNYKLKKSIFCKILNLNFNFSFKFKNLNFYLEFVSLFMWYISIHHIQYLDKPIKCLKMRTNIKSKGISKILSSVFLFIFENRTFFQHT